MNKIILLSYYTLLIPIILFFGYMMRKGNDGWYKYIADYITEEDIKLIGKDKLKNILTNTLLTMIATSIFLIIIVFRFMENKIPFIISLILTILPIVPMISLKIKLMSLRMIKKI